MTNSDDVSHNKVEDLDHLREVDGSAVGMMKAGKHTPGPWMVSLANSIFAQDNQMRVADVRGWGYLTGAGHGALGLDHHTAASIQDANAALIARAPELAEENQRLREALRRIRDADDPDYPGACICMELREIATCALGEEGK